MAKKSIKEAAAAGTSVFDQIARGNTTGTQIELQTSTEKQEPQKGTLYIQKAQDTQEPQKVKVYIQEAQHTQEPQKVTLYIQEAQDTQDTQGIKTVLYTQDAQDTKSTLDVNKEGVPLARLNLKIPAELKAYLIVAAAKASIEQRRNISLTEYLCQVVREDMERHKDD